LENAPEADVSMTSAQATVGPMIKRETKRTRKNGEKAKRVAAAVSSSTLASTLIFSPAV